MKVPTKHGLKSILDKKTVPCDGICYILHTNKERIVCDRYQSFYIKDIPVCITSLKKGDIIDGRYHSFFIDEIEKYIGNPIGNVLLIEHNRFFLANGVEVNTYV